MDISEYLKFFSELGVSHLRLPDRNGKMAASVSLSGEPRFTAAELRLTEAAPVSRLAQLEALRAEIGDCQRCKLAPRRTHLVFGSGNPDAELMFVGEGPGEDEDLQGLPFVGKAGQLLTRIIEAIDLKREQVYIANIVKCRPPNNRTPEPDEIAACRGFVEQQIRHIEPLVIVALGKTAAQTLLNTETPISRLRGRFFDYKGRALMPTYHPSYLLRKPEAKREVWEDMKAVREKLKELGSSYYR
ncbi:MAG TPA: uracil-DNA glycosylase [Acidobacteriota bacterium]|nr:uracil-DNA glycosylase [Acidobacteriota bacterium]